MVRTVDRSPYISPVHKLSSVGGLEALRRAADEEYERSGNAVKPRSCQGKPKFTGFAIAVIKGPIPPPPPRSSNQVAIEGGNNEKAEIEIEGEVTQDELMDEPSEHSAGIC